MSDSSQEILLVGDNPFHNISHLSQDRSRSRSNLVSDPQYAAGLVKLSSENGADGFLFSVSDTTLSILRKLHEGQGLGGFGLYPIVPYAYEYVKLATQTGGISGLAKHIGKEILYSRNLRAIAAGLKGVARFDPVSLLKTYLFYEINRINCAAGKGTRIQSVILHEIVTDLALALDLDWFFEAYKSTLRDFKVIPGFNTCNFAYLVDKFGEWHIDLSDVVIASPFNSVGFQMNPSKAECEKKIALLPKPVVIAISIMAAGYLKPHDAIDYIATLPNIKGVAVGVSKESHAVETFKLFRSKFANRV